MAKILNDDMLKQILEELGSSVYFYQKEKGKERKEESELYDADGSVTVIFTSELNQVEPGEKDILGKVWIPKTKDDDGNPLLDKNNRPRQAWSKFEVKAIIKGKEKVYGLGSDFGAQFRGTVFEMAKNNIKSNELPGTKWKYRALPNWKWDITYLGRVELPKEIKNGKSKEESNVEKVKAAVLKAKENQPRIGLTGVDRKDLVDAVAFLTKLDEKKVNAVWSKVLESGVIKEVDGKVFYI